MCCAIWIHHVNFSLWCWHVVDVEERDGQTGNGEMMWTMCLAKKVSGWHKPTTETNGLDEKKLVVSPTMTPSLEVPC